MQTLLNNPDAIAAFFAMVFVVVVSMEFHTARKRAEANELFDWATALVKCLEKEDLTAFPKGVRLKGIDQRVKFLNRLGVHAEVSCDKDYLFIDYGDQTITLVIH